MVNALAAVQPGLGVFEAEMLVKAFFEAISAQLETGGRVELRGFGVLNTRARVAIRVLARG